jgi:hypothetical protein
VAGVRRDPRPLPQAGASHNLHAERAARGHRRGVDMASELTKTTTDHDEIRRWAEERGGWPAEVARTEREGQTGIIRIDFPGYTGEGSLKRISWDEWFDKFDRSSLAFVYQEETSGGARSNFNKLVGRETAEARARGESKARRPRSAARGTRKAPQRAAARVARPAAKAGARGRGATAPGGRHGAKAKARAATRRTTSRKRS